MRERREKERTRERSTWRERECVYTGRESIGREIEQEDAGLRVRREGRRRGSRVAQLPQTWGSRPAFKSGREENSDAVVGSASR